MLHSLRTVNQLPLANLWDDDGDVNATRERNLSQGALHELLRNFPVEFCIADVGHSLRLIPVATCYEFWKSEVKSHLVDDPQSGLQLEQFPGEYAYVACEWSGQIKTPIVLLE